MVKDYDERLEHNCKITKNQNILLITDSNTGEIMCSSCGEVLTDRISDLLFVTEQSGVDNLINEGFSKNKIHFVGNCMIDSISKFLPLAKKMNACSKYGLRDRIVY